MNQPLSLPVRVRLLALDICREHEVDYVMLVGLEKEDGRPLRLRREKTPELVRARRALIHRIRDHFDWSASRIAGVLGLHHTTVLWHLKAELAPAPYDFSKPDESGVWAI